MGISWLPWSFQAFPGLPLTSLGVHGHLCCFRESLGVFGDLWGSLGIFGDLLGLDLLKIRMFSFLMQDETFQFLMQGGIFGDLWESLRIVEDL